MAVLRHWPPLAHLLIVGACAATAWWRIDATPVAPAGAAVLADPAAPAAPEATEPALAEPRDPSADIEAVAARALFRPGRQQVATVPTAEPTPDTPEPPAPEEAVAADVVVPVTMVGFLDQGGRRSAILRSSEDGQSHVVREGDEIAGLRVVEITASAVVVETGGQRVTVKLYPD
ncbi:hypothetical protein [Rubellimicrobium roseum]|uniref:Type II secretion system protein GspC N-terminal domain-containing protein n=1 Tax=Rubellimicrobium roseum TaxID=687525 RepID=A0A5C4N914_9RHOB|nr:hypothetical protein [Rubellimicrobium roseum]TNC71354.1 hypothetical protein FHG71_12225 [Rubellimicrobium roseum]